MTKKWEKSYLRASQEKNRNIRRFVLTQQQEPVDHEAIMSVFEAIVMCGFWLLAGHALADFTLQTDVMAKYKNRHNIPENIPPGQKLTPCWGYWLSAHALEHGACVALVTGSILLGLAETVSHWLIDFVKCESWIGVHADQILHVLCKCLWLCLFLYV